MGVNPDFIKALEEAGAREDVFKDMIHEGQEIIKKHMEEASQEHNKTGQMLKSVKKKEVIEKDGSISGDVVFSGTTCIYRSKKTGKKVYITNWLKAFRIEYGVRSAKPRPFIGPAVKKAESHILKKWNEMMEEEMKRINDSY